MLKNKGVFFWDSFPNYGCAAVDHAGVDDASGEGDLFDRPGNKRGAGVRDGLATARAERGLDTIFGLVIFCVFHIFIFFHDDDRSL